MSDVYVTLSGNVTADPRQYQFPDGSRATSLRLAVNRRVLDRQSQTWTTQDTTYYTIRCYRALADNVAQSVRKGHPLVVYGRLRIKQFQDRQGEQRFLAEVEASSLGHDLKWGIASFEKPVRSYAGTPSGEERQGMEDATREWELRPVPHADERDAPPDGRRDPRPAEQRAAREGQAVRPAEGGDAQPSERRGSHQTEGSSSSDDDGTPAGEAAERADERPSSSATEVRETGDVPWPVETVPDALAA
ncbi:single-stranded DNA-binding protein [Microtetraspora malaysiensis]|uniref:single-stranded DNA-binding protein n=1 Tax=Microtetraspora malaysiensis TaxID=161358 RepID=UPI003D8B5E12